MCDFSFPLSSSAEDDVRYCYLPVRYLPTVGMRGEGNKEGSFTNANFLLIKGSTDSRRQFITNNNCPLCTFVSDVFVFLRTVAPRSYEEQSAKRNFVSHSFKYPQELIHKTKSFYRTKSYSRCLAESVWFLEVQMS